MDRIICQMMEGITVSPEEFQLVAAELRARISNGDCGDDVPILMEIFGCNYDAACSSVSSKNIEDSLSLFNTALLTSPKFGPVMDERKFPPSFRM